MRRSTVTSNSLASSGHGLPSSASSTLPPQSRSSAGAAVPLTWYTPKAWPRKEQGISAALRSEEYSLHENDDVESNRNRNRNHREATRGRPWPDGTRLAP